MVRIYFYARKNARNINRIVLSRLNHSEILFDYIMSKDGWSLVESVVEETEHEPRSSSQTEKDFWTDFLLKKLIEIIPGRYKRGCCYVGKKTVTFRFTKSCECSKQWKFTAEGINVSKEKCASFKLYENDGECKHESETPRPRYLKGKNPQVFISHVSSL